MLQLRQTTRPQPSPTYLAITFLSSSGLFVSSRLPRRPSREFVWRTPKAVRGCGDGVLPIRGKRGGAAMMTSHVREHTTQVVALHLENLLIGERCYTTRS